MHQWVSQTTGTCHFIKSDIPDISSSFSVSAWVYVSAVVYGASCFVTILIVAISQPLRSNISNTWNN